jgi:hypothetical protein
MFAACGRRVVAAMSAPDARADALVNWSDLGVASCASARSMVTR